MRRQQLIRHCPVIVIVAVVMSAKALANNGFVDFQVLHLGTPARSGQLHQVINSRDALLAYWYPELQRATPPKTLLKPPSLTEPGPLPDVDFSKDTLLIVSVGEVTGHTVVIANIFETELDIRVTAFDISSGPKCAIAEVATYPSAAALISHSLKSVSFTVKSAVMDC